MAVPKLKKLRDIPIEELIRRYDKIANNTGEGINYYLNEIARRDQEKHSKTILKYTKRIALMTLIVTISTIINIITLILHKL